LFTCEKKSSILDDVIASIYIFESGAVDMRRTCVFDKDAYEKTFHMVNKLLKKLVEE
jgi:hypothetical protein